MRLAKLCEWADEHPNDLICQAIDTMYDKMMGDIGE
jgi:hypothetical protein